MFLCLKIDEFLVFVTDFHQSVSLAVARQLLWQELFSFMGPPFWVNLLRPALPRDGESCQS